MWDFADSPWGVLRRMWCINTRGILPVCCNFTTFRFVVSFYNGDPYFCYISKAANSNKGVSYFMLDSWLDTCLVGFRFYLIN